MLEETKEKALSWGVEDKPKSSHQTDPLAVSRMWRRGGRNRLVWLDVGPD